MAVLVIAVAAYLIGWQIDPYVYGFAFLGLAPIQLGLAGIGIIVRLAGLDRRDAALPWAVDVLLLITAAVAAIMVKTISWT